MMVEIQPTPLPHDIQFILDESLDQDNINGFDHLVLYLFADRQTVINIVELPRPTGWKLGLRPMCLELDKLAHGIADQLPVEDQLPLVAASLLREAPRLERLAECHASWNYVDSTVGGAFKKFLKKTRVDKLDKPIGQAKRRLYDQRSINHYVRELDCESTSLAVQLAKTIEQRRPWPDTPALSYDLERHFREQERRYQQARERAIDAFTSKPTKKKHTKFLKQQQRTQRKIAIRSAEAAASVIGRGNVMTLARNEPVFIAGSEVTFRLEISQLHRLGHGALAIALYDRPVVNRLADMCLFFDDTPCLEQAAAIALHVSAGEELELVSTGNLSNVTVAGASHPIVASRLRQHRDHTRAAARELVDLALREPAFVRQAHNDMRRIRERDYVAAMTPRYLEPLLDRVWANKADQLRSYLAQL